MWQGRKCQRGKCTCSLLPQLERCNPARKDQKAEPNSHKEVCIDSLRGDCREGAVWEGGSGRVNCGVVRCPRHDAESEGAVQERKGSSWWRARHKQRPGMAIKSHILGATTDLLIRTQRGGHESLPCLNLFQRRDVRQGPNFWCPSLMSCPESGSSTAEKTTPLEIKVKYDHDQDGDAQIITGVALGSSEKRGSDLRQSLGCTSWCQE